MTRIEFPRHANQRVELRIGSLRIAGASRIEARRLAEALPAALEAAIAGRITNSAQKTSADDVAGRILTAASQALDQRQ